MIVGFDDEDLPVQVSMKIAEAGMVLDTPVLIDSLEEADVICAIEESETHGLRWDVVKVDETITEDIAYYMDAI